MSRARISDAALDAHEEQIALLVRIQNETKALGLDLDIDTLAFVHRRLTAIIEAAGRAKAIAIARMNEDKAAARDGRENGS